MEILSFGSPLINIHQRCRTGCRRALPKGTAEGICRRALKKGRMTEAFCVASHRRRQTVDAQKWFGTFEANLVMRCDG
ncbi:unnamed protein product [Prunus armeniaca]